MLATTVLLSACGKDSDTPDVARQDGITNQDCARYVDYLSCVADELGDAGQATKQALEQTVSSRTNYTDAELASICEWAIAGIKDIQSMYEDFDCTLEEKNADESDEESDATGTGDAQEEAATS